MSSKATLVLTQMAKTPLSIAAIFIIFSFASSRSFPVDRVLSSNTSLAYPTPTVTADGSFDRFTSPTPLPDRVLRQTDNCTSYEDKQYLYTALNVARVTTTPTLNFANNLHPDNVSAVLDMVRQMTELLELQTTVNQMLEEERKDAGVTVKTEALSVIVNQTFEQACKWVTATLLNEPQLNCSSPSVMRKLMVHMRVYKVTTEFEDTLRDFNSTANNPDYCKWIQCKLMPTPSSDGCVVAEVIPCTDSVSCSK